MSMMVQNMASKKEVAKLQQVFTQLDTNKDGKLQYDELLVGYTDFFGAELAQGEVDRIFELVDVDKNGEIEFSEFVTATVSRDKLLQDEKLKQAFLVYDKDNSGSISVDEIRETLGVGKKITLEAWNEIVTEVDSNGDGEISFEEFKTMMRRLLS